VPDARTYRLLLTTVAVSAVAMLLGVGIGGGGLYLAGFRQPEVRQFTVAVQLKREATAEQQAAIRARLQSIGTVTFESSEQAYARFKQLSQSADLSDALSGLDIGPDSLPASFSVASTGTEFRCATTDGLRDLPGVGSVDVYVRATRKHASQKLAC
jgi:cell division protein FtsX